MSENEQQNEQQNEQRNIPTPAEQERIDAVEEVRVAEVRKRGRPLKGTRSPLISPEKEAELKALVPAAQEWKRKQRIDKEKEQRRLRSADTKELLQASSHAAKTVDEFWRRQRETLSDEYRRKLEVIEEEAKTLLFYCTHGHELDPSDEDFVSLHDHIDLMQTFADEHGLISDSHFESPELEDWSPRVMVWSTEKEISQGYTPFWQDPLRFRLLTTSEGSATRLYCLYGVEGITDTHLAKFKFRIQEHQTASSERRRMHIIHESFRCYLCRFETTHGRKYPKEYL